MSESDTLDAATVKTARDEVYSLPIESLNVANSALFKSDAIWPYFERLRAEDPVHWQPASDFEPHWATSAASCAEVWGVSSLGLSMTRLPAANAVMAGASAT